MTGLPPHGAEREEIMNDLFGVDNGPSSLPRGSGRYYRARVHQLLEGTAATPANSGHVNLRPQTHAERMACLEDIFRPVDPDTSQARELIQRMGTSPQTYGL